MKTKTFLIAAVMFLGLSTGLFAQSNLSVVFSPTLNAIPVSPAIRTAATALTGDLTIAWVSGATFVDGQIIVTFGGVPITNTISTTLGSYVLTCAGTINCSGATPATNPGKIALNSTASSNAAGQLVFSLNAGPAGGAGSVIVRGLRLGLSSVTGITLLNASAFISGNALDVSTPNPIAVFASVTRGIVDLAAGNVTASTINTVTGVVTGTSTVAISENFAAAFNTANELYGATAAIGLRFTLSQAPPAGVVLTFPAAVTVGAGQFITCDSSGNVIGLDQQISSTTTTLSVYYRLFVAPSNVAVDTATVTVGVSTATATLPLPAALITVRVCLAPVGSALSSTGGVVTSPVPRYTAADESGAFTLVSVGGGNTTLLLPYTSYASGYDTGIAISNSTLDPGGLMGFNGATASSGTLTFYFYPARPTPTAALPASFSYTTKAGSPGSGLDGSGILTAGSTYSVLLSQLLSAAGQSGNFTGYIFVITNFPNAHGLYVLSNFQTFSQGSLALVVAGTGGYRNALAGTPENLNN